MAKEIERKFLVMDKGFISGLRKVPFQLLTQGYLSEKGVTTRVRQVDSTEAWLTIKGPRTGKCTRDEFEYPIPVEDARVMLGYCGVHKLQKRRYHLAVGKHVWHVDVYHHELEGLVTAEVELTDETEKFRRPDWLGPEVTGDKRFSNRNLSLTKKRPTLLAAA